MIFTNAYSYVKLTLGQSYRKYLSLNFELSDLYNVIS